jgi:uncharacterized membrane protein SpoIIM required for sporulation
VDRVVSMVHIPIYPALLSAAADGVEAGRECVRVSFDRCIEAKMMMGSGRVVGGDVSGGVRSSAVLSGGVDGRRRV